MNAINIEKFYYDAYGKIVATSDNFLYHFTFIVNADFITVNGNRPSQVVNNTMPAITDFVHFMVNNKPKFNQYFGDQKADELDSLIFESPCDHLSFQLPAYDAQRINCKKIPASSKSIIALLNYELEMLSSLREKMFKFPKEIKASENGIGFSPIIVEYANIDFYRLREVRGAVMESLVIKINSIIDESLQTKFVDISSKVMKVSLSMLITIGLLAISFSFIAHGYFISDLDVSLETFRNLPPESIMQNPFISNGMKKYHRK